MAKLSNTKAELKKSVAYKKKRVLRLIFLFKNYFGVFFCLTYLEREILAKVSNWNQKSLPPITKKVKHCLN